MVHVPGSAAGFFAGSPVHKQKHQTKRITKRTQRTTDDFCVCKINTSCINDCFKINGVAYISQSKILTRNTLQKMFKSSCAS